MKSAVSPEFRQTTPEESLRLYYLKSDQKYKLSRITTEIEAHLINLKRSFFEIGKLLSKAKQILPHGTFQLWIEKTFQNDLPYSTAYAYMTIYERFKGNQKVVQMLPITFLMNISQSSFPEEITKLILENSQYLETADVNTIKDVFKQYKAGELNLKEFTSLVSRQITLGIQIAKGQTEKRISTNMRKTLNYGVQDLLDVIYKVKKGVSGMRFVFPAVEDSEEEKELIGMIDKTIFELEDLKKELRNKKGMLNPIIRTNPLIGSEILSVDHNSNN